MKKILVLDNYDSFTYNLVHLILGAGNYDLNVVRNDKIDLEEISVYDYILLSPGPGIPSEAGIMLEVIEKYARSKKILGVCLGHQGIAQVFGATLMNMKKVKHGISSKTRVVDVDDYLFKSLPQEFSVGRYHSWTVLPETVSHPIVITALDNEGQVMAISHQRFDVKGVQFHPESIMTDTGEQIIKNWLEN